MKPSRTLLRRSWAVLAFAGLLVLLVPACKLVKKTVEFPGKVLRTSDRGEKVTVTYVQTTVMRFADSFNTQIGQATVKFTEAAGTLEARIQALTWRVQQTTSALTIASGPNPTANLLDMVVLVTLGRMVHEEHWMPEVWGEADRPMLEAYQQLEEEIGAIAEQALSPKQIEEVHETIREWREKNPGPALTGFVRLPSFRRLYDSREKKSDVFKELADLLSLDPFEGLEPATREAAELRVLGERTLFYAQRVPLIFTAQAELLALKVAQIPEVKEVAEGTARLSKAAERISESTAKLPELMTEAQGTLEAGTEMSKALEGAIRSFDELMARFQEWPESSERGEERSRPFDVTEYGEAAARVGQAAKDLNELISGMEKNQPKLEQVVQEVAERSDRSVDRALNRGLLYGMILIAAWAVAAIVVRRLSPRRGVPGSRAPAARSEGRWRP